MCSTNIIKILWHHLLLHLLPPTAPLPCFIYWYFTWLHACLFVTFPLCAVDDTLTVKGATSCWQGVCYFPFSSFVLPGNLQGFKPNLWPDFLLVASQGWLGWKRTERHESCLLTIPLEYQSFGSRAVLLPTFVLMLFTSYEIKNWNAWCVDSPVCHWAYKGSKE